MQAAPLSEPYQSQIWRVVEAQHVVSTLALVDSLEEQELLEAVLERSKPPVPEACRHLDYLLATPFRYGCYPSDSRFRRKGQTPGVFYGAEKALTAALENVWYRLKFFAAAPEADLPTGVAEYSAFAVKVAAKAVDLTRPPMSARRAEWADPDDYTACLDLADAARAAGIGAIRYASVRDPDEAANVAVLSCAGFASPAPVAHESWRIILREGGAVVRREWPAQAWEVRLAGTRLAWA